VSSSSNLFLTAGYPLERIVATTCTKGDPGCAGKIDEASVVPHSLEILAHFPKRLAQLATAV
jgi:hypothetical protein